MKRQCGQTDEAIPGLSHGSDDWIICTRGNGARLNRQYQSFYMGQIVRAFTLNGGFPVNCGGVPREEKPQLGAPLRIGEACGFYSFRANNYKLHFFESASGLKVSVNHLPRSLVEGFPCVIFACHLVHVRHDLHIMLGARRVRNMSSSLHPRNSIRHVMVSRLS